MHKLTRSAAPACLAGYQHGVHQWARDVPSPLERMDIWACLETMQQTRCAYCESALVNGNKHIEHFRQRSKHPAGTFDWANLFGSCNRKDTCGRHKDSCGPYNHRDLLKPDIDDPEDFLVFVSDGTIVPRTNQTQQAMQRARETLRVLNLDASHGALRHMRRAAAEGYLQTAEEFQLFAAEFDEADWRPLLDTELASISQLPFVTAIRHVLISYIE